MVVCTRVRIPADEFLLADALSERPGVRIELERVVPFRERTTPTLWIASQDAPWVTQAVGGDETVDEVEVLDAVDGGLVLQVDWAATSTPFLDVIAEADATCLKGIGTADGWSLTLRYPTHEAFTASYHRCSDEDIEFSVESVRSSAGIADYGVESMLTEPQREALNEALACGYFDVPRGATLQTLADRLGISDTAASQRLRRGIQKVLSEQLR
ncbi:hypothetical protein D3D02_08820 [Halobellus sp. Atlit-38R]|nr:hypothetical protein D3D02_08820 [Halobellus sp. Atlit-38R]